MPTVSSASRVAVSAGPEPRELIAAELAELVEIRRDLHRHPELFYRESRTSSVVQRELARLRIPFKANIAKTGVVGHLAATTAEGNTKPAIAIRADMDALPIVETTGKPWASTNPGVMHACGHDGHTTMLLGAARVLAGLKHRPRPVTFIFQPAEEGGAGGDAMCKEGALRGGSMGDGTAGLGTPVGEIYGLHGWPQLPLGTVATKIGPLLASVDDIDLTIRGVQCHGAYPQHGNDPILAAAHIITAIQSIASRNVGPLDSVVVTIGQIEGGSASNIIPERVRLIGTVRTLRPETRKLARERFIAIASSVARGMGCEAEIDYQESYPVTENHPAATQAFIDTARAAIGTERVTIVENPTMGGEDFSYYGHHVPACFFFLGLKPEGAATYPTLHQPDFDFNDDAIALGVELFCRLAVR
jgi:amidohydrolase